MTDIECDPLERIVALISEAIKIADDAGQSMVAAMLPSALDKANAALTDMGCDQRLSRKNKPWSGGLPGNR